jgi:hypothetical protein
LKYRGGVGNFQQHKTMYQLSQQLREAADILDGGLKWECYEERVSSWYPSGQTTRSVSECVWKRIPIRRYTEPKQVQLEQKDWLVGGPWYFRSKTDLATIFMATKFYENAVGSFDRYGDRDHSSMMSDYERSNDGINWQPCSKPE